MNRPLSLVLLLLAFSVLLGTACDEKFEITKSPDLVTTPEIREQGEGVWISSLYFDRQDRNRSQTKTIQVRNNGEAPLTIRRVYIENFEDCDRLKGYADCAAECDADDESCTRICEARFRPGQRFDPPLDEVCEYSIDTGPPYASAQTPLVLDPERRVDYDVVYRATKPTEPGSAVLVIESDDRDKPSVRIDLDVVAASPRISVSPTTVVFPSACANSICVTPISLINRGSGSLTINSLNIRRLTPAPRDPETNEPLEEFILDPTITLQETPFSIEAGSNVGVDIQYSPKDEGIDNAQLVIESSDPQQPAIEVFMTSGDANSELVVQPNPLILNLPEGAGQTAALINFANSGLEKLLAKLSVEQEGEEFELTNCIADEMGCTIVFEVLPGGSRSHELVYTPRSGSAGNATLVVETDADNVDGVLRIPVLASGAEVAALGFDPISVNMNDTGAGTTGTETVTLTNTGGLPLDISRIGLSVEADGPPLTDAEFSLSRGGQPTMLMPGGTHEVDVTLTRAAEDSNLRVGSLIIESNAATSPDRIYITSTPQQP